MSKTKTKREDTSPIALEIPAGMIPDTAALEQAKQAFLANPTVEAGAAGLEIVLAGVGSNGPAPEPELIAEAIESAEAYAPPVGMTLEAAREETGEQRLIVNRPDWSRLASESIQVRVQITCWRATTKLQAHHLGLDAASPEYKEFAARYVRLGNLYLLPARYWKAFESKQELAHRAVRSRGFRSPWNGYLVPIRSYKAAREELEQYEKDCDEIVARICAERDPWTDENGETQPGWLAEVRGEIRKLVVTALAIRAGLPPDAIPPEDSAEVFAIVDGIVAEVPSAEQIRAQYSFTWVPSFIQRPALLGEGIDVAALEQRALDAKAAHETLSARIAVAQASLIDRTAEEKARLELAALEETLAAQKLIARDMADRAADAQLREIQGLLTGAAAKVAGTLLAGLTEIRRSTDLHNQAGKATGGVGKKELKKLQRVADQVQALMAWDSPSAERLVEAVRELAADLEGAPKDPEAVAKLHRTLGDIQAVVAADLVTLGDPDRELLSLKDEDARDFLLEDRRDVALERLGLVEPSGAVELIDRTPGEDLVLAGAGREL